MRQIYSHILTFWFKHKYFSDELLKSLAISFSEETLKTIRNLELIIKPFAGGFNLLTSNPELLNASDNFKPLQIYLFSKDPKYINYTELPSYNLSDNLLYFNNLSNLPDSDNRSFLLHQTNYASKNDVVRICHGKISIPDFKPEINYRFTDAKGNEISSESVTLSSIKAGFVNISGIEQGLVRIHSGNEEILKEYYYPQAIWKKPLGIVELFTDELNRLYKANGKVDYAICFDNRKTTWKYFLVSQVFQKFDQLSIINKAKEQVFLPPQRQLLYQNTNALVFESKSKIPLSELSDDNFQLVNHFDPVTRSGKVILKSLAKATSQQLFSDSSKTAENVYSHIYL
jgi:hypothetical protein